MATASDSCSRIPPHLHPFRSVPDPSFVSSERLSRKRNARLYHQDIMFCPLNRAPLLSLHYAETLVFSGPGAHPSALAIL